MRRIGPLLGPGWRYVPLLHNGAHVTRRDFDRLTRVNYGCYWAGRTEYRRETRKAAEYARGTS